MATGQTLDFSGFYIWLTSNIGSAELMGCNTPMIPRWSATSFASATSLAPGDFARVTEKLVFRRLSYEYQLEIASKFLEKETDFKRTRLPTLRG